MMLKMLLRVSRIPSYSYCSYTQTDSLVKFGNSSVKSLNCSHLYPMCLRKLLKTEKYLFLVLKGNRLIGISKVAAAEYYPSMLIFLENYNAASLISTKMP